MIGNIFISSLISETDFELIFGNASFPLTKAELIHKAKTAGVSSAILDLIYSLPSRFYHSKGEVIHQFIIRKCKGLEDKVGTFKFGAEAISI